MSTGILHVFASSTWGGGEQYVYDLAQEQLLRGYRVVLLSSVSESIHNRVKDLKAPYLVLKNKGRFSPFSILRMRQIILREKIDIVHVHQFRDAFIAVLANMLLPLAKRPKVVITRHLVRPGKTRWIRCWLYKKLYRLIFVSELAKKSFEENVRLPLEKTVVVYNCLPDRKPVPATVNYRSQYAIADDCLVVGFLGRLVHYKGVELLLDVAERLKDRRIVFFLAGSGEKKYEAFLKKLIAERHLENQFFLVGFLEHPENFIIQMNVGVLPSLCVEAFGFTVLEFMRMGIPTIASNTGAQVEFVKDGENGLLVAPTVNEVSRALQALLDDESKRQQIGKNALLYCQQNFNYNDFFNKIIEAYGL